MSPSSLTIELLESPDHASFAGVKKSLGPSSLNALTFGVLDGKLGCMRTDPDNPISSMLTEALNAMGMEDILRGFGNAGGPVFATHSQLLAAMDSNIYQELQELHRDIVDSTNLVDDFESLEDRLNAWLDQARERFEVAGRAWLLGSVLLVSFWGTAPEDGLLSKVILFLRRQFGGDAMSAAVWMQDDNLGDWDWVQPEVSIEQLDPETLQRIKTLSAILHTATPEEKARIRAEIAQLRGEPGRLPPVGSTLQDKRAKAAGFDSYAEFRGLRPSR